MQSLERIFLNDGMLLEFLVATISERVFVHYQKQSHSPGMLCALNTQPQGYLNSGTQWIAVPEKQLE